MDYHKLQAEVVKTVQLTLHLIRCKITEGSSFCNTAQGVVMLEHVVEVNNYPKNVTKDVLHYPLEYADDTPNCVSTIGGEY